MQPPLPPGDSGGPAYAESPGEGGKTSNEEPHPELLTAVVIFPSGGKAPYGAFFPDRVPIVP